MNYYSTLDVPTTASADDIKKAYRKLAKEHHPDTGGDGDKFKQITEAYNILSDVDKRRLVDRGIDPTAPGNGNYYNVNTGNLHDMFSHFSARFNQPRNRSINIGVEITLEEVLHGKTIDAQIGLPGGEHKIINISIPPGVTTGQQVKYRGMGDAIHTDVPAGDLYVNIIVRNHPIFERYNENIIYEKHISMWDAILGATIKIPTLNSDEELTIKVPAEAHSRTVLKCKGHGLPMLRNSTRGNLLVKIIIDTPTNLSDKHLEMITQLQKETT